MKIRTLIVDDEPLARGRLRSLLSQEPDVEIVAECDNGKEAINAIREGAPDLVFLDVQMPEVDGFGVLAALPQKAWPAVIFCTAYDKFALKAFEVHALDYLLKPFDKERFQTALNRARAQLARPEKTERDSRVAAALAGKGASKAEGAETKALDRLAIKADGRVLVLKTDEIDWIEAADNYVNLHLGTESHLHRETMSSLESKLPPEKFIRIGRSTIVNLERIKELQPLFHGDYCVILRNGTKLTLSRNYREKLNHLLGK